MNVFDELFERVGDKNGCMAIGSWHASIEQRALVDACRLILEQQKQIQELQSELRTIKKDIDSLKYGSPYG